MTTSDAFLVKVRRTAAVPTTVSADQVPGDTDDDLLAYADEEIQGRLLSLVMSNRDEFYVAVKDYAVTARCARYQIPSRAIGGKLRDVFFVTGNGDIRGLPRIEPENVVNYANQSPGEPQGFYFENANVVLVPTPSSTTGTLRLKYFTRPGRLVLLAAAKTTTAATVGTGTATLDVTAAASQAYDVISSYSPFPLMAADTDYTVVSGTQYTFTFAGEAQAFANSQINYMVTPGTSPVIQLPEELTAALVQRTAARYLEARGDRQGAAVCDMRADKLENVAMVLLAPRADGKPKRVTGGLLFRGSGLRWWP